MPVEPQIIKADGSKEPFLYSGDKPTLKELQEAVGGFIEMLAGKNEGWVLLVDEDGNRKDLSYNEAATDLVSPDYMMHNNTLRGTAIHIQKSIMNEECRVGPDTFFGLRSADSNKDRYDN